MLKRNELTGNKTDNPDFLKVLLTLKANIMKDLNVCEICKVVDISKDSYVVNPINNTKEKLYCKTITNSTINKGDLVLVIFTNSDYRLNLKKIKAGEKPQEVAQTDLHSRNYGVIIATGSSSPSEVYSKVYVNGHFAETFNADTKANVDDLNKEITDRQKADSALQSNIDDETTNRQNADKSLQTNIDNEATARSNANKTLQDNIDKNSQSITTINNTINSYGNIVTHDVDEFATSTDLNTKVPKQDFVTHSLVTDVNGGKYHTNGIIYVNSKLSGYDSTGNFINKSEKDSPIVRKGNYIIFSGNANDITTIDVDTEKVALKEEIPVIKAGTNINITISGNEITINAETSSGGTNVYVNNVKQDAINFTSDPQTQINTLHNNYMPKTGGTFTGSITLEDDVKIKSVDVNHPLLYRNSSGVILVGNLNDELKLYGSGAWPKYNDAKLALLSDIKLKCDLLFSGALTNGQTTTLTTAPAYDLLMCCCDAWNNTGGLFFVPTAKITSTVDNKWTYGSYNTGVNGSVKGTSAFVKINLNNNTGLCECWGGYDNTQSSGQMYIRKIYGLTLM